MSHLPEATKAGRGRAGIPTEVPGSRAWTLNYPILLAASHNHTQKSIIKRHPEGKDRKLQRARYNLD